MPRTAAVGCIVALLLVGSMAAGCGGKVIHLGNGVDGGSCAHSGVNANQVLWIGDSWILVPGSQVTRVEELAQAAGAIGPNDAYANAAAPATTMSAIADQYDAREAGATKVKVLIMDGGTWDTLVANGSEASVNSAAAAFEQHLAKVASDGTVAHVVYFLPPELPGIPGVAALHPRVQQSCAASAVPCHFLDLQPLWTDPVDYTASNGILPTEAGAQVLANAIWAVMQDHCIAQ
jgi:hypothetical protein